MIQSVPEAHGHNTYSQVALELDRRCISDPESRPRRAMLGRE
jgi:hypothetical protein